MKQFKLIVRENLTKKYCWVSYDSQDIYNIKCNSAPVEIPEKHPYFLDQHHLNHQSLTLAWKTKTNNHHYLPAASSHSLRTSDMPNGQKLYLMPAHTYGPTIFSHLTWKLSYYSLDWYTIKKYKVKPIHKRKKHIMPKLSQKFLTLEGKSNWYDPEGHLWKILV